MKDLHEANAFFRVPCHSTQNDSIRLFSALFPFVSTNLAEPPEIILVIRLVVLTVVLTPSLWIVL